MKYRLFRIGSIEVRPYLMGDCAFALSANIMKTTTITQKKNRSEFEVWERHAANIRKPTECAFGILKNRFLRLQKGFDLDHEDGIAYCVTSCVILHNLALRCGDIGEIMRRKKSITIHLHGLKRRGDERCTTTLLNGAQLSVLFNEFRKQVIEPLSLLFC